MNELNSPYFKIKMPISIGKRYRLNLNEPSIGLNDKPMKLGGKTYNIHGLI